MTGHPFEFLDRQRIQEGEQALAEGRGLFLQRPDAAGRPAGSDGGGRPREPETFSVSHQA
jgi:hypothetical protein